MYPKLIGWLPAIALIPMLGALLNAALGRRLGKTFVTVVGVGAPAIAFSIAAAFFAATHFYDQQVVIRGERASIERVAQYLDSKGKAFSVEDDPRRVDPGARDLVFLRLHDLTLDDQVLRDVEVREPRAEVRRSEALGPYYYVTDLGSWIAVAGLDLHFKFVFDRLAAVLVLVITGVGTLIHIYSTRYMEHEDAGGFARYFTYLNLFVGSMLILVLGGDLFLLFVGWEGVGLCSYLLIGFHYQDPANAACGSKAFIVNRIGDLGFVLGVLTLLVAVRTASHGGAFSADIEHLNVLGGSGEISEAVLGAACLLLFLGATGKSAQIPLHLWLPDAMAGPTPVSALIHAATMVTAGVYMIARLSPLFAHAVIFGIPVLGIVAVVGIATAFFAATAAIGQDDIKRVLAYSTVSQLGYMFVGVGAGAYGAAVFHLVTHAFFKALLFLAAGSVIHACGSQSLREMGGLRKYMPVTFITMAVGALALAAFPFLMSGFYSKDMILGEVLVRGQDAHASYAWNLIYFVGVLTGALTAVYSTRLIYLTFMSDYRGKAHPHESPVAMTAPLVILAVLSVIAGVLGLPKLFTEAEPLLPHFLSGVVAFAEHEVDEGNLHKIELTGLFIGSVASLAGIVIGIGYWRSPDNGWELPAPGSPLERIRGVLARAWLYDDVVNKRGVQPAVKYFSHVLWRWIDDETIDRGVVDGAGRVSKELSLFARAFQTGGVARYAGYFTAGVLLLPVVAFVLVPGWHSLLTTLSSLVHTSGGAGH